MHIQPFLYLVYGVAWIIWLVSLRATTQEHQEHQSTSAQMKCAQVRPLLATFLYILAWVFLVSTVMAMCFLPWVQHNTTTHISGGVMLVMVLLIVIFALQIRYIDDIRKSSRTVKEDCTQTHRFWRTAVYAFAIFIFIIGLGGVFFVASVAR